VILSSFFSKITTGKLTVDMVDLLVGNPAVVLQDVEVLCANGRGNLLGDGQQLGQRVVGDVCELLAVVLGDDELDDVSRDDDHVDCIGAIRTAWPLLRGLMSRNA
jgi:hypothetical protein